MNKYQLIQHRLLEPAGSDPDFTRGTLEGDIAAVDITFYRHVLIQKRYPHHGAVAFGHYGKSLFAVFKFLGIEDIAYNQPKSLPYPTENPWV